MRWRIGTARECAASGTRQNVAYVYDGIVGLPTDFGTTVTLAEYLAAIGEEGGSDSE